MPRLVGRARGPCRKRCDNVAAVGLLLRCGVPRSGWDVAGSALFVVKWGTASQTQRCSACADPKIVRGTDASLAATGQSRMRVTACHPLLHSRKNRCYTYSLPNKTRSDLNFLHDEARNACQARSLMVFPQYVMISCMVHVNFLQRFCSNPGGARHEAPHVTDSTGRDAAVRESASLREMLRRYNALEACDSAKGCGTSRGSGSFAGDTTCASHGLPAPSPCALKPILQTFPSKPNLLLPQRRAQSNEQCRSSATQYVIPMRGDRFLLAPCKIIITTRLGHLCAAVGQFTTHGLTPYGVPLATLRSSSLRSTSQTGTSNPWHASLQLS